MTIRHDLEATIRDHEASLIDLTSFGDTLELRLATLATCADRGFPAKASGAGPGAAPGSFLDRQVPPDDDRVPDENAGVILNGPERAMDAALKHQVDMPFAEREELKLLAALSRHEAAQQRKRSARIVAILIKYPGAAIHGKAKTCPVGACISCYRINATFTPVKLRASGEPYFQGKCKWCGERTIKGRLPLTQDVAAHLRGERVTKKTKGPKKHKAPSGPTCAMCDTPLKPGDLTRGTASNETRAHVECVDADPTRWTQMVLDNRTKGGVMT